MPKEAHAMRKNKILVTGGAGFIASHIVDAYISLGHKVIVVDNLSTGKLENINKKATFYQADIRDLERMKQIFQKEKPQIINHHAAIAEVVKSLRDPRPTLEVNLLGTTNILVAGGEVGIKKIIFASSGGTVYGHIYNRAKETDKTKPVSPYGLSKLLGEECIKFYANNYGFNYLIFRYPNIYGSRQNPKGEAGVIAIFCELMKNGQKPTIFGDGKKTREYVNVADIIKANSLGLNNGTDEILNLGWGKMIQDKEVFDTIAKIFNFKENPIYAPHRKGEAFSVHLNVKKAAKILDWKPTIKLEEGIRRYVKELYG